MYEFKHIKDKSKNSVTIRIRDCMYVEIVLNKFMYIGAGANEVGLEYCLGKDFMERLRKEGGIDYRVTEESLKDRLNIIMLEECLNIDNECRVFTVHGGADTIIPVVAAHEFAKVLPNQKLQIIEGADHQAELASLVVYVIKETLQISLL
ncbi:hypothetical protein JHK85_047114 [Glycine max]|nr:hypothetical protein JHK87_046347 [Glycine soja]KAG4942468.1 hypothetical protein JHK85_047114 [Glycine max]